MRHIRYWASGTICYWYLWVSRFISMGEHSPPNPKPALHSWFHTQQQNYHWHCKINNRFMRLWFCMVMPLKLACISAANSVKKETVIHTPLRRHSSNWFSPLMMLIAIQRRLQFNEHKTFWKNPCFGHLHPETLNRTCPFLVHLETRISM